LDNLDVSDTVFEIRFQQTIKRKVVNTLIKADLFLTIVELDHLDVKFTPFEKMQEPEVEVP